MKKIFEYDTFEDYWDNLSNDRKEEIISGVDLKNFKEYWNQQKEICIFFKLQNYSKEE